MKKTLFALLACATLVAPAMADDTYSAYIFGVSPCKNDEQYANYSLYLIVPTTQYASIASLQTTLGSGSLDDFTTKFLTSGTYCTTSYTTKLDASEFDDDAGYVFAGADDYITTNIPKDTDDNSIFAVWVYDNGLAGDENTPQFSVATVAVLSFQSVQGPLYSNPEVQESSDWSKFATAKTPEPATATLSLLALAGLAVRRRRH